MKPAKRNRIIYLGAAAVAAAVFSGSITALCQEGSWKSE